MGTFVRTLTGRGVDFITPDPAAIDFRDVAYNLSNIQRYAGGMAVPWSVAQHCLLVRKLLVGSNAGEWAEVVGLLHDAHEAYTNDIPAPLKEALRLVERPRGALSALEVIESGLDHAIFEHAGVLRPTGAVLRMLKVADKAAAELENEWMRRGRAYAPIAEEFAHAGPRQYLDALQKLGVPVDV